MMKVETTKALRTVTSGETAVGTSKSSLHWKNILVPTDLSEFSKKAIEMGVALAQEHKANIFLLYVVPFPVCCSCDAPPDTDEMLKSARNSLDEIARTFPPGLNCKEIVRLGTREPVQQIVEEACNMSADLIIVGTHGYGGFKRALLGNTAERVIRHSPCPVLVARSEELNTDRTFLGTVTHDNPFKTSEKIIYERNG